MVKRLLASYTLFFRKKYAGANTLRTELGGQNRKKTCWGMCKALRPLRDFLNIEYAERPVWKSVEGK